MRYVMLSLLLLACAPARVRVDADAGPLEGDAANVTVDAFAPPGDDTGVDAGTVELADAYMVPEQDAELPDAATVPDDAFVGADSAPGAVVLASESCPRILAEFRTFPCDTVVFHCPYITSKYEFEVEHCISEISDVYYNPVLTGARTGCESINLLLHNRVPTACN
jgi:hypothetical protein